ncbi:hypothetical protein ACHMW7_03220 [Aminobacter sp. UC22_36]|uniref:hypothetical protein n=1 Tax=Aminobacter sp. UC22_36 TaxID=3374549 RepID=UPI0037576F14
MAAHYRVQLAELHDALQEDSESKRMTAANIVRSLVQEIVLTPDKDELQIDVRGDLAGILAISLNTQKPALRAGFSQVELVAGTGFEPVTFSLWSAGRGATIAREAELPASDRARGFGRFGCGDRI